ncbi:MAG TPA: Mth938-like domain-containing protein [Arenimonas sp.]|nr:Mth938-like domain-containing protein [Arenimonas sp.]
MQLVQDPSEFRYVLRGVSADGVLVNQRTLTCSFLLAPNQLLENWRPASSQALQAEDFEAAFEWQPEVILLGTGLRQRFPSAAVLASVLRRGVGLEAMDSGAAARTFNVLASEGRRVVAGFLVPG